MSEAARALLYLRALSGWNSLLSRLRRLRQPKYLIGAVFGVAYLYFTLIAQLRRSARAAPLPADGAATAHVALIVGAVLVMVFVALCWVLPRERASLAFTEAEIAMLFPAPVRRRTLIHYRLLSGQLGTLFAALIVSFVFRGFSLTHGDALFRIVGVWLALATLSLHFTASSFVVSGLQDRGYTALQRQLFGAAAAALVLVLPAAWIAWQLHLQAAASGQLPGLADRLLALMAAPPITWLLLPAQWLLGPLLARDAASFLRAMGPAALLFAAHYWWVLRSELPIEEASLARAEKRARVVAAARAGKVRFSSAAPKARSPAFALQATGRVETAFLWKNLLATVSYLRPRTFVVAAGVIVALTPWIAGSPDRAALATAVAMALMAIGAYALLIGPQFARQDLRQDLAAIDTLKTYPLPGWQIVAGELLTPIAILSGVAWLLLLAVALWFRSDNLHWLTPGLRAALALLLALLIPLLCALQLLVINAAVLLFPAWTHPGQPRGGGVEVMGQRMLFFVGQFVVTLLALLPAIVAAALFYFTLRALAGVPAAVLFGAASALTVLASEVALGIMWLGGRFERLDSSAELNP